MQLLPKWVLTNRHPSIYDAESGTVIEMTAKVYAAMQSLIEEYNAFAETTNKIISEFKAESESEQECFHQCVTELIGNYIKSIDVAIDKQDAVIADAVKYMKDNITATATEMLNTALTNGTITVAVEYDEETESLYVVGEGNV